MIKKIFKENVKHNIFSYLLLLILIIFIVLISLLPAKILEHFINDYLNSSSKEKNLLIKLSTLYLSCLIFTGVLDFFKQLLLVKLGEKFTKDIRYNMAKKLEKMEASYFVNHDNAIIQSIFINDVDAINSIFQDGIISMAIDLFKIIGIVILMFLYSVKLGLITLIIIPFIYVLTYIFKKLMYKAQLQNRKMIGIINNHIYETFSNDEMFKLYNKEDYMVNGYNDKLKKNYKTVMRTSLFDSIYSPMVQIITAFVVCIIIFFQLNKTTIIGISLGATAASIQYITNLFAPIESLGMELQTIQKATSGLTRVKEFFNEKEIVELDLTYDDVVKDKILIEIKNVVFSYNDEKVVLDDVSITIKDGTKCLIIGRTGVGKTTLFKLIIGDIKPIKGEILLNGINTYLIPNKLKYQIFGYVSQSFNSLDSSLIDNITMKNDSISVDNVISALKIVGLYDKVFSYSDNLNTKLKTLSLSFGELQLVSIARAIVANPKILLFDEITASLDTITEQKIYNALEKASLNKTIIQITHRLENVYDQDIVVMLENGKKKFEKKPFELLEDPWFKTHLLLEKDWK